MSEEKTIKCDGLDINYFDSGSGKAILFIHNGGGFWQIWTHQLNHFSKNYRVLAIDLPGFGKSDESNNSYTLDYNTFILEKFIEKLSLESFHIVGNCIGASLAISLKKWHPHLVDKIVLINICPGERLIESNLMKKLLFDTELPKLRKSLSKVLSFLFTKTPLKKKFPRLLFGAKPDRDAYLFQKYILLLKTKKQTRSRINLLFASPTYTLVRFLDDNSVTKNSSLIWGEKNRVAGLKREAYYHSELCGIPEPDVIRGGGHLCMYEYPDQVNALIEKSLEL